ncbi:MAG: LamG-like jellyroll fold domain-containing protein [Trichodesmium sp.]
MNNLPTSLVFVDASISNYQQLMAGIDSNAEVILINGYQNGIDVITNVLAQRHNLQNIQILSHGSEGALYLGNSKLDSGNLQDYSAQLDAWGKAMADCGDLMLYGCNVAAGDEGKSFVEEFSQYIGRDVAASEDLTGSGVRGGDWDLEVKTGDIEARSALVSEVRANFGEVLDYNVEGLTQTYYDLDTRERYHRDYRKEPGKIVDENDTVISENWGGKDWKPHYQNRGVGRPQYSNGKFVSGDPDWWNAEWTGYFVPRVSGYHSFKYSANDYVRFQIDVNQNGEYDTDEDSQWTKKGKGGSVTYPLETDKAYPIQVSFSERTRTAQINFTVREAGKIWVGGDGYTENLSPLVVNQEPPTLSIGEITASEKEKKAKVIINAEFKDTNNNSPNIEGLTVAYGLETKNGAFSHNNVEYKEVQVKQDTTGNYYFNFDIPYDSVYEENEQVEVTLKQLRNKNNPNLYYFIKDFEKPFTVDVLDDDMMLRLQKENDLTQEGKELLFNIKLDAPLQEERAEVLLDFSSNQPYELSEIIDQVITKKGNDNKEYTLNQDGRVTLDIEKDDGTEIPIYLKVKDNVFYSDNLTLSVTPAGPGQYNGYRMDEDYSRRTEEIKIINNEPEISISPVHAKIKKEETDSAVREETKENAETDLKKYREKNIEEYVENAPGFIINLDKPNPNSNFKLRFKLDGSAIKGPLKNPPPGSDYKLFYYNLNDEEQILGQGSINFNSKEYWSGSYKVKGEFGEFPVTEKTTKIKLLVQLINDELWEPAEDVKITLIEHKDSRLIRENMFPFNENNNNSFYKSLPTKPEDNKYYYYKINRDKKTATLNIKDNEPTVSLGKVVAPEEGFGFGSTIEGLGSAIKLENQAYVSIPQSDKYNFSQTKQFTQEAWVYPNQNSGENPILGVQDSNSPAHPHLLITENNSISAGWGDRSNYIKSEENVLNPNNWNHIATTFDGEDYKIYVNGVEIVSTKYAGQIPDNTQPFDIGRNGDNYFQGAIDEVRLWNVARTPGEIQQGMLTPLTAEETGLVGYWTFENNTNDSSSNENHGVHNPDLLSFDDFNIDNGHNSSHFKNPIANPDNRDLNNSLLFSGPGSRQATTPSLDTRLESSYIIFDLIFGNRRNGGSNANLGEDVALEYSINGTDWLEIAIYNTERYIKWTTIRQEIPEAAKTEQTQFRWRQVKHNSIKGDNWGLANVRVSTNPYINNPAPQIGYIDVNLDQPFEGPQGLWVNYDISELDATQGIDYLNSRYRKVSTQVDSERNGIIIPQGETSARIYIVANPDELKEENETVEITLKPHNFDDESHSSETNTNYRVDAKNKTTTVTIKDNDAYKKEVIFLDKYDRPINDDNPLYIEPDGLTPVKIKLGGKFQERQLANDTQNGLNAEYFEDRYLQKPHKSRQNEIYPNLNKIWDWATELSSKELHHGFSIRWTGYIIPRYSEDYTFTFEGDTARLKVNGMTIINYWYEDLQEDWEQRREFRGKHSAKINLEAGKAYPISLEYTNDTGGNKKNIFLWHSESENSEIVPSSQLFVDDPFVTNSEIVVDIGGESVIFNEGDWDQTKKVDLKKLTPGSTIKYSYNDKEDEFITTDQPPQLLQTEEGSSGDEVTVIPDVSITKIKDVTEGEQEPGEFLVNLNAPASKEGLEVEYSVTGTAQEGENYKQLPEKIVVEAGETQAILPVFAVDDNTVEQDKTVKINLPNPEVVVLRKELKELDVNTNTNNDQTSPRIAALSNGDYVIIWESNHDSGSFNRKNVSGQRYDAEGNMVGEEFEIGTGWQETMPEIAPLLNGGFLVTWGSDLKTLYGQQYDANANKVGEKFQINTQPDGDDYNQRRNNAVAPLSNGGFIATWQSKPSDNRHANWEIYGQRYKANGEKDEEEFKIDKYRVLSLLDKQNSAIASLLGGGFVITFDYRDADRDGIYCQRYDANGNLVGNPFRVNTTTKGWQTQSAVAQLSNGGFIVTWQSLNQDNDSWGIYGQRYDANAKKEGKEFRVNTTTKGWQSQSAVASLSNGGFIITWQSPDGIYGQSYKGDGDPDGQEFLVKNTQSNLFSPTVKELSNGNIVVAWHGNQDNRGYDIYNKIYTYQKIIDPKSKYTVNPESDAAELEIIEDDYNAIEVAQKIELKGATKVDFKELDNSTIETLELTEITKYDSSYTPIFVPENKKGESETVGVFLPEQPTANVTVEIIDIETKETVSELTFTPDNWNEGQEITFTGKENDLKGFDYNRIAVISQSEDQNYNQKGTLVQLQKFDDSTEYAPLASAINTSEAGVGATVGIRLSSPPTTNVTVELSDLDKTEVDIQLSDLDKTEAEVQQTELIFTPENWDEYQDVTITGKSDGIDDGDIEHKIAVIAENKEETNYHKKGTFISVINQDIDENQSIEVLTKVIKTDPETKEPIIEYNSIFSPVDSSQTTAIKTSENGTSETVSVGLVKRPTADVTLELSSDDTTEGEVTPSITFTPDDWDKYQDVTITGKPDPEDDKDEEDVKYQITIKTKSDDNNYNNTEKFISVINTDVDDSTGLELANKLETTYSSEFTPIETSETGTSETVGVRLSNKPTADVTVELSSDDTTEGEFPPTITFTPDNWDEYQDVTITGKADKINDEDVKYDITLRAKSEDADYDEETIVIPVTNTNAIGPTATIEVIDGNMTETKAGKVEIRLSEPVAPGQEIYVKLNAFERMPTLEELQEGDYANATEGEDYYLKDTAYFLEPIYTNEEYRSFQLYEDPFPKNQQFVGENQSMALVKPAFGDIDGDGDTDVVVGIADGILKYLENKNGKLENKIGVNNPFSDINVSGNAAPALADINGDGKLDLVVGDENGNLSYFINKSNTTNTIFLDSNQIADISNPFANIKANGGNSAPKLGDLDGDGLVDLVLGGTDGSITYYLNEGRGNKPVFNSGNSVAQIDENAIPISIDWDRDGDLDILATNDKGQVFYLENVKLDNQIEANFTQAKEIFLPGDIKLNTSSALAFEDFEGDGDRDLFIGMPWGEIKYVENFSIVTFKSGEDTKEITIQPIQDLVDEAEEETIVISLETNNGYQLQDKSSQVELTIKDDDQAGLIITPAEPEKETTSELETGNTLTYTAKLDSQPTGTVAVYFGSKDETEGLLNTSSDVELEIDNGENNDNVYLFNGEGIRQATTKTFNATNLKNIEFELILDEGNNDGENAQEQKQKKEIVLEYSTDGGNTWSVIAHYDQENDSESTSINRAIPEAAQTPQTQLRWRQLSHNGSDQDNWRLANIKMEPQNTDVIQLQFTPENWDEPQKFFVTGVNDDIDDGDVPYEIITTVEGEDFKYRDLQERDSQIKSIKLTNSDDEDQVGLDIEKMTEGVGEGRDNIYKVQLKSQPAGEVRVIAQPQNDQIRLNDESYGDEMILVFDETNWNVERIVRVSAFDDNLPEFIHKSLIDFKIESGEYKDFESAADNNSWEHAIDLEEIKGGYTWENLALQGNDSDWFKFSLEDAATQSDFLRTNVVEGEQDRIKFNIYGEENFKNAIKSDNTEVDLKGLERGEYYVQVFSPNKSEIKYDLIIGDEDYKYQQLGNDIEPLEVQIIDNDLPTARILSGPTAAEISSEPGYFTIMLDTPLPDKNGSNGIEVNYEIVGGTATQQEKLEDGEKLGDYKINNDEGSLKKGSVRIAPGQVQNNLIVVPIDDKLVEDLTVKYTVPEKTEGEKTEDEPQDGKTSLTLDVKMPIEDFDASEPLPAAINFRGESNGNSYIYAPRLKNSPTNAITIEGWFKPNSVNNFSSLVKYDAGGGANFHLFQENDRVKIASVIESQGWNTKKSVSPNQWQHLAVTFSVDSATMKLYVDGEEEASKELPRKNIDLVLKPGGNLYLGDVISPRYKGLMSDIRVWNTARTSGEIQENYNRQLTGKEEGLVAYYPMITGEGNTLIDATGNRNNGFWRGEFSWEERDLPPLSGVNDSSDSPTVLTGLNKLELNGLQIHSQDEDWYKLTLLEEGGESDKITMTHSGGDLDIKLYKANETTEDGKIKVHSQSNKIGTEQEGINLNGLEKGIYYLQVVGKDNATGDYSLDIEAPLFQEREIAKDSVLRFSDNIEGTVLENTTLTKDGSALTGQVKVEVDSEDVEKIEQFDNKFAKVAGETVEVQLLPGEGYQIKEDKQEDTAATLVIQDDDVPGVRIVQVGENTTVGEQETATFAVSLLSEPTKQVTITLTPGAEVEFVKQDQTQTGVEITGTSEVEKQIYSFEKSEDTVGGVTFDLELNSLVNTDRQDTVAFEIKLAEEPKEDLTVKFSDANNEGSLKEEVTFIGKNTAENAQSGKENNNVTDNFKPHHWSEKQESIVYQLDELDQDENGDYKLKVEINDDQKEIIIKEKEPTKITKKQAVLTVQPQDWYKLQTVTVRGSEDTIVEPGIFHKTPIKYEVQSGDESYSGIFVPNQTIEVVDMVLDPKATAKTMKEGLRLLQNGIDEVSLPFLGKLDKKLPKIIEDLGLNLAKDTESETLLTVRKLQEIIGDRLNDDDLGLESFSVDSEVIPKENNSEEIEEITFTLKFFKQDDEDMELDPKLGMPAVGLQTKGTVNTNYNYDVSFKFGWHHEDGFYIDTEESNVDTGVKLDLNDVNLDGTQDDNFKDQTGGMGLLPFQLEAVENGDKLNGLKTTFKTNVKDLEKDDANNSDSGLTLEELSDSTKSEYKHFVEYEFPEENSEANLKLNLTPWENIAELKGVVPMSLDLNIDGMPVFNYGDQEQAGQKDFNISLSNVNLDIGGFYNNVLKPMFKFTNETSEVWKAIANIFGTDTKFLSYLGQEFLFDSDGKPGVSLAELIDTFITSYDDDKATNFKALNNIQITQLGPFFNNVVEQLEIAEEFGKSEAQTKNVSLVNESLDFTLKAASEDENESSKNQYDNSSNSNSPFPTPDISTIMQAGAFFLGAPPPLDFLFNRNSDLASLLNNPTDALSLVFGKGIDLYKQNTFNFNLGYSADKSWSYMFYPGIEGELIIGTDPSIKAQLTQGFDTYGLEEWSQEAFDPKQAYLPWNGYYLDDFNKYGEDVAEFSLGGSVYAGLGASAVVIKGELKGGLALDLGADLEDEGEKNGENDGKVRGLEIPTDTLAAAYQFVGDLDIFLKAEIKVGFKVGILEVMKTVFEAEVRFDLFAFGTGTGLGKNQVKAGVKTPYTPYITNISKKETAYSYPADAIGYLDTNLNGKLDNNEPVTTTDSNGELHLEFNLEDYDTNNNGQLDPNEGKIVVMGGVDSSSGVPITTELVGDIDDPILTPLIHLGNFLVEEEYVESKEAAEDLIIEKFNLSSFKMKDDPLEKIGDEDELSQKAGVEVYLAHVQLQNLVVHAIAMLQGANPEIESEESNLQALVTRGLAKALQLEQEILDLRNAEDLEVILKQVVAESTKLGGQEISDAIIEATSDIVTEANALIDRMAKDAAKQTLNLVMPVVAPVKRTTLEAEQTAITEKLGAGELTPEEAKEQFTTRLEAGNLLESQVISDTRNIKVYTTGDGNIDENSDETIEIVIELEEPAPSQGVNVNYNIVGTATEGEDYEIEISGEDNEEPNTLYIDKDTTRKTIKISSIDDEISEGKEFITLEIKGVSESVAIDSEMASAIVEIIDDEEPPIPGNIDYGETTTGNIDEENGGNGVGIQGSSENDFIAPLALDNNDYILQGNEGNDTITGYAGNDILIGGEGKNDLSGGNGADYFVFESLNEGLDRIIDFDPTQGDKIIIDVAGFDNPTLDDFTVLNGYLYFRDQQIALIQKEGVSYNYFSDLSEILEIKDTENLETPVSPPGTEYPEGNGNGVGIAGGASFGEEDDDNDSSFDNEEGDSQQIDNADTNTVGEQEANTTNDEEADTTTPETEDGDEETNSNSEDGDIDSSNEAEQPENPDEEDSIPLQQQPSNAPEAIAAPDNPLENSDEPKVMKGTDGSDTLSGTSGNDLLYGMRDDDMLYGYAGEDTAYGGKGNDVVMGGDDGDLLYGDNDNDIVEGEAGNDEAHGNRGLDFVNGGDGDDMLRGGKDADRILGGIGEDTILGEKGNDLLDGGEGDDTLSGGEGSDRFVLAPGNGSDIILDFEDGIDLLELEDGIAFADLIFTEESGSTLVEFDSERLAVVSGVAPGLLTAEDFIISEN